MRVLVAYDFFVVYVLRVVYFLSRGFLWLMCIVFAIGASDFDMRPNIMTNAQQGLKTIPAAV